MSFLSGSWHSIIVMLEPTFTHTLGQLELEMSIIERNLEDEVEVEVEAAPGHRLYAALPTCQPA